MLWPLIQSDKCGVFFQQERESKRKKANCPINVKLWVYDCITWSPDNISTEDTVAEIGLGVRFIIQIHLLFILPPQIQRS